MCYGIGNCIGSGIFISMGVAIGFTGHSVVLALLLANALVLFAYAYKTLMSGMFVLPGGAYSQAALLQPPLLIGVTAISSLFTGFAFAMFALTIVEYASVVFPQIEPYGKWIALAIVTAFFITTFFGGKFMGKFNLVMVVVLILSLLVYIAVGLPRVDFTLLSPAREGYLMGGPFKLVMAIAMLAFACQGATMPIAMTADAEKPKKNLPKAILLASLVVTIVYSLIGAVTVGILPVEQVQDKALGEVAKEIFPYPVFVVFILGGACFAIATSLYGAIAGVQHPLMSTIEDGWLPAFLGKKTKKGYPWVMMLALYIIAFVPIFVDLGLQEMISLMMIPTMLINTINNCLMLRLVKKYPGVWKKSFFHMPKWGFRIVIVLSVLCSTLICAALFTTLKSGDQYFMSVMLVLLFAYSFYRLKAKKVNLSALETARREAEKAAHESEEKCLRGASDLSRFTRG